MQPEQLQQKLCVCVCVCVCIDVLCVGGDTDSRIEAQTITRP